MNKFEKVSYNQFKNDLIRTYYQVIFGSDEVWDDVKCGFVSIKDVHDNITLPSRSTNRSAGYDFHVPVGIVLPPESRVIIPTGIKAQLDDDHFIFLDIRSSVAIKRGLVLVNTVGIIDADYYNNPDNEGHIMIALNNPTNSSVNLAQGERVAQGIIIRYVTIDDDSAECIRLGGFGSSGK